MFPGQSERPQDWDPSSIRLQLEGSLRRLGTDYVDLYQLHNARIEPGRSTTRCGRCSAQLRDEGKVREIGVALGPAIGWVEEGLESIRRRPIASLQTVFNIIEQEPGLTFASEIREQGKGIGLIARVPHASDTLSGQGHPRHRVPARGPPLAPQPRQHARQLRQGRHARVPLGGHRAHPGPGRDRGHPRQPGVHHRAARPTWTSTTCGSTRPRPTCRSPPDEVAQVDELWRENFGVENRYEMPLKSSR